MNVCFSLSLKLHILNLGHGVLQPTPEANVAAFVDAARKHGTK